MPQETLLQRNLNRFKLEACAGGRVLFLLSMLQGKQGFWRRQQARPGHPPDVVEGNRSEPRRAPTSMSSARTLDRNDLGDPAFVAARDGIVVGPGLLCRVPTAAAKEMK